MEKINSSIEKIDNLGKMNERLNQSITIERVRIVINGRNSFCERNLILNKKEVYLSIAFILKSLKLLKLFKIVLQSFTMKGIRLMTR